jgi:hypothetical protein
MRPTVTNHITLHERTELKSTTSWVFCLLHCFQQSRILFLSSTIRLLDDTHLGLKSNRDNKIRRVPLSAH